MAEPAARLGNDAIALSGGEFDNLMAALGPFEEAPVLAVGVSGGPDSMSLCALSHEWARARGGRAVALVVDHRLRPESGDEARRVCGWLDKLGVEHQLLTRQGPDIHGAVHASARAARYDLMGGYCRDRGILHLLLGHHRDDQAETMLLRLDRASGLDGLAAMAAINEDAAGVDGLRLLRPLLAVPMARLRAVLTARGLPFVDDPSNRDPAYGRARMRLLAPVLAADGVTPERLARTAAALGRARFVLESAAADFLAAAVTIHPAGFCRLRGQAYRAAPAEIARRALRRMLLCIGGAAYAPRGESLLRLHAALAGGDFEAGRTLGGCRILPGRRGILICREPRAANGSIALEAGGQALWDGRFLMRSSAAAGPVTVRRLDSAAWARIPREDAKVRARILPGAVRSSLPAVCDLDGIVAVPHLGYMRRDNGAGKEGVYSAEFRPTRALSPAAFAFTGTAG